MKKFARATLHLALVAACFTNGLAARAQASAADAASATLPGGAEAAGAARPASGQPSARARKAADRSLKRRVHAALAHTKRLNATRIILRVRDGVVTLQGSVGDSQQAGLAEAATRRVSGVTAVQNQLRINSQLF